MEEKYDTKEETKNDDTTDFVIKNIQNVASESTPLLAKIKSEIGGDNKIVNMALRLDKCSKICLIPGNVGSILLGILGLILIFAFPEIDMLFNISFFLIFGVNLLVSYLCMYMTYKYGTIDMYIKQLKSQTKEFSDSLTELKDTKIAVTDKVAGIQDSVSGLQKNCEALEDQMEQFEQLQEDLQQICKDQENMVQMIDSLNAITQDMQDLSMRNLEAQLYNAYYDVQFKDDDEGLSSREYTRFLNTLDKKTRKMFTQMGTFSKVDLNNDGVLCIGEFKSLIENVLEKITDEDFQRYV